MRTANLLSKLLNIRHGRVLSLASVELYDIIHLISSTKTLLSLFNFVKVKFNGFFNLYTLSTSIMINNNNNNIYIYIYICIQTCLLFLTSINQNNIDLWQRRTDWPKQSRDTAAYVRQMSLMVN